VFEPLDFIARLAALVPPPRAHLARYHGVFAPHSRWRKDVVPGGGGGSERLVLESFPGGGDELDAAVEASGGPDLGD
jgi:hypothetical protein